MTSAASVTIDGVIFVEVEDTIAAAADANAAPTSSNTRA
jgi:hypothetical protein